MKGPTCAFAVALAFATAALASSAAAQEEVSVPQGEAYVQAATGMTFPAQVGDFNRISVYRYAADGSNESAGYNLYRRGAEIAATVYVSPSPGLAIGPGSPPETVLVAQALLCSAEFDRVQLGIQSAHEGEALVEESGTTHGETPGFRATYTFTSPNFAGRRNIAVKSEAYLFCYVGGRWSVKYRFTYPADHDVRAAIDAFMRDLAWTIGAAPQIDAKPPSL
ncbi:MAG: hypothetical protein ACREH4_01120 [Vitreimonas sp.]